MQHVSLSGWLVLPLLFSLGSAREGGKLKLHGSDSGQIEFEPTGTAKLIGDERSINTTVDFGVGGELIVGDQAASGVAFLNISGCTLSSEGLAITTDCPLRDTESSLSLSEQLSQIQRMQRVWAAALCSDAPILQFNYSYPHGQPIAHSGVFYDDPDNTYLNDGVRPICSNGGTCVADNDPTDTGPVAFKRTGTADTEPILDLHEDVLVCSVTIYYYSYSTWGKGRMTSARIRSGQALDSWTQTAHVDPIECPMPSGAGCAPNFVSLQTISAGWMEPSRYVQLEEIGGPEDVSDVLVDEVEVRGRRLAHGFGL